MSKKSPSSIITQGGSCPASWLLYIEGKERAKIETDCATKRGKFSKPGDLLMRLVWGGYKRSPSPHPLAGILKGYRGRKWAQPHTPIRWSQLSEVCILENGSHGKDGGRVYIPRTGEGVRSLLWPGSHSRMNWKSRPPDDLLPHPSLCDWFLYSYPCPSSAVGPEQSARAMAGMEVPHL